MHYYNSFLNKMKKYKDDFLGKKTASENDFLNEAKKYRDNFFGKIKKYGDVNRYDILKTVALTAMIVDHLGLYIFKNVFFFRVIGRVSMPIFAILYGFSYKKANHQILVCAVIMSIIAGYLHYPVMPLNILYTLYIFGFTLKSVERFYRKHEPFFLFVLVMFLFLIIPSGLFVEYGFAVLYYMFFGVLVKKENLSSYDKTAIFTIYLCVTFYMYEEVMFNKFYCFLATLYLAALFLYMRIQRNSMLDKIIVSDERIKKTMLICSRYSLYLYVLHIAIYMLIARCLL
jgi:hypothetical protein